MLNNYLKSNADNWAWGKLDLEAKKQLRSLGRAASKKGLVVSYWPDDRRVTISKKKICIVSTMELQDLWDKGYKPRFN